MTMTKADWREWHEQQQRKMQERWGAELRHEAERGPALGIERREEAVEGARTFVRTLESQLADAQNALETALSRREMEKARQAALDALVLREYAPWAEREVAARIEALERYREDLLGRDDAP